MSFRVSVTGIPADSNGKIWRISELRYPVYDMMNDPVFRQSVDSTLYMDYVTILNTEDALELHNKYRLDPSFEINKKSEQTLLERLKKGAPETIWVVFEINEW